MDFDLQYEVQKLKDHLLKPTFWQRLERSIILALQKAPKNENVSKSLSMTKDLGACINIQLNLLRFL